MMMVSQFSAEQSMNTTSDSEGREMSEKWLNKSMKIQMTDGRVLIGVFVCTDQDCNVILGSCHEYLTSPECNDGEKEEPRVLGLAMVPGHHIVSIHIDESSEEEKTATETVDKAQGTEQDSGDKTQDSEDKTQDGEDKTQDREDKTQDSEDKTQDSEDKTQDSEDKTQDSEDKTQDSEDRTQDTEETQDTDLDIKHAKDKTPDTASETQDAQPSSVGDCNTMESAPQDKDTDSKEWPFTETQSQTGITEID